MTDNVNKIRNADFSAGSALPSHWEWNAATPGMRWERVTDDAADDGRTMTITSDTTEGYAFWSQEVACKGGEYYRVDATVRCDLSPVGDRDGFVLRVEPLTAGDPGDGQWFTPGVGRAEDATTVRAVFDAPKGTRRVRISVGIVNASGRAEFGAVRFIPILEPDAACHLLAVPPPSTAYLPPCVAKKVLVCSETACDRSVTGLLSEYFGGSNVRTGRPSELRPSAVREDALLLPDPIPPPGIRSLASLKRLAKDRVVVISLPAFATLSRGAAMLRRIEQPDDPIHAKVVFANYVTHGFALHDVFPHAGEGRAAGSFVQNQYRKTRALGEFCDRHGFVTLLNSMCDKDATSDQPICLYKTTDGGGLFVFDLEPLEATGSSFGEPTLGVYLLLSILGQTQAGLGQFVAPVRKKAQFRDLIREAGVRFKEFIVHDADVPADEVTEQLVTIGREDESFGLPLRPKPVIIVRSGLNSGDVDSVYGAFIWFKNLIRSEPYPCPYTQALASRFRLAWIPSAAPWEASDGWCRGGHAPRETTIEMDGTEVAALIDIVSRPVNRVRVVLPRDDGPYQRYVTWLPRLIDSFAPGRYFAPTAGEGAGFADRSRFAWQRVRHDLEVVADADEFTEDAHRDVLAIGGHVVRIELPGNDADFVANSIQRTDLAATLLEQVVGLQYGLIAVNRYGSSVRFDGFRPVGPGEALLVDGDDPALHAKVSRAG